MGRRVTARFLRRLAVCVWVAAVGWMLFDFDGDAVDRTLLAAAVTTTLLAGLRRQESTEADKLRMAFWAGVLHAGAPDDA